MTLIIGAQADLLRYRLATAVGGSGVTSVDVLTVMLTDDAGQTGFGMSYVLGGADDLPLAAARTLCDRFVTGRTAAHPIPMWREMRRAMGRTGIGPYGTAQAAIDVALWDRYARTLGVPLGVALGGSPRRVPVYGSGSFTANQSPQEAAARATAYAATGVRAVKVRVAGTPADAALMAAVVAAVDLPVFADANEKCTPLTAARLVRDAADAGIAFVEEPLPSGDLAGYRALARTSAVPLATGEHLGSRAEAAPFLTESLCALMQPDLQALGGLTPCLALAQFAEACNVEIAPHVFPGLFVHLAAAAPNLTWLEDFPLFEPLFDGLPQMTPDGTLGMRDVAGHGLTLASGARETYRLP